MLIVHLFVSLSCICLLAMHTLIVNLCHFFSSSWCQGLAATSACGSPWTFLFTFLNHLSSDIWICCREFAPQKECQHHANIQYESTSSKLLKGVPSVESPGTCPLQNLSFDLQQFHFNVRVPINESPSSYVLATGVVIRFSSPEPKAHKVSL